MVKKQKSEAARRPRRDRSESAAIPYLQQALTIIQKATSGGVANPQLALMGMILEADLLHGGAYAVAVNKRPYFANDPSTSPYYAGDLKNTNQGAGIAGFFASLFSGQNAGELWNQIMTDANVPHVLPKLLSDEAYAEFMIIAAQTSTTELFKSTGTGLKTYVEAAAEGLGAFGKFRGGAAGSATAQYKAETERMQIMLAANKEARTTIPLTDQAADDALT
jgi:hypothetical protein